jgi:hypothetical protein
MEAMLGIPGRRVGELAGFVYKAFQVDV